jgi:low affinity Fe/Cu permease
MDQVFTIIANRTAAFIGRPYAFVFALCFVLIWAATGPLFGYSDTWQLVVNTSTTIVTFLIVFLIQNSQNRDAAAIQAKLDELIRATKIARNEFIGIEHLTDHQLEMIREALEAEGAARNDDLKAAHAAVSRLIVRN